MIKSTITIHDSGVTLIVVGGDPMTGDAVQLTIEDTDGQVTQVTLPGDATTALISALRAAQDVSREASNAPNLRDVLRLRR